MTDYIPPCRRPENDPNDWFIEKDGRQYIDEPVLTADEVRIIWDLAIENDEDLTEAVEEATEEQLRLNIAKRRHAKDKCFTECKMRGECLQLGLSADFYTQSHGIWGGYYPEELRAIQREGRARRRRRPGVD